MPNENANGATDSDFSAASGFNKKSPLSKLAAVLLGRRYFRTWSGVGRTREWRRLKVYIASSLYGFLVLTLAPFSLVVSGESWGSVNGRLGVVAVSVADKAGARSPLPG